MADPKKYLSQEGLEYYDQKIKGKLDEKVDKIPGKSLSTVDFTSEYEQKLQSLTQFSLTPATEDTLGGVKIETKTDNVTPAKGARAIKVNADGVAFIDWTEAPKASSSTYGLAKFGEGFTTTGDGTVSIDPDVAGLTSVSWNDIKDKPDVATKSDIVTVYTYKGSVDHYSELPKGLNESNRGWVYYVEDEGVNYAWVGIGETGADESGWDKLGGSFSISEITLDDIDKLFK